MFTEIWKILEDDFRIKEVSLGLILILMSAIQVELTEICNSLLE